MKPETILTESIGRSQSSAFTTTLPESEPVVVTVTIAGPDFHDSEEFAVRDPRVAKAKARKLMSQAIKAYRPADEVTES